MRSFKVRLIAAKELLDTVRDRRTLFVAFVLPLLLYPALLIGMTQILSVTRANLKEESQKILLDGDATLEELSEALRAENLEPVRVEEVGRGEEVRAEIATLSNAEGEAADEARGRLRQLLVESKLSAAMICEGGFADAMDEGRQAEATLVSNPTNETSKAARGKIMAALKKLADKKRDALRERLPDEAVHLLFAQMPVKIAQQEVATKSQKGAYAFAPMLGMLIVIMALTGAFYPAVDLVAGEKERGTMETLLVAPVTRREIVLGKFLTVWIIAMVTALLNLGVMALTFSKLAGAMGAGRIEFSISAGAVIAATLILIPTSALFGAVALALSSFATSYKEGQHYMTPLFLVATPLSMVGLLPNVEIGYGLALVPVANVVLLVKAMLLGGEAMGPALVAIASTFVYAVIALKVTIEIFKRESVLFRSGAGQSYDATSLATTRKGLPQEKQAILLFFTVIALMFFMSRGVASKVDAVLALVLAQAAVIVPTFVFAKRSRLDLRETFSLRGFRWQDAPAIVGAAICSLVLVLGFYQYLMPKAPEHSGMLEIQRHLESVPVVVMFLLFAVLPPICEELMYRGFVLSSLRPRRGDLRAVVITAAMFAAMHLEAYRLPGTFLAGLMLGFVLVRTRSIFAAILFHMAYNGTIFLSQYWPEIGYGLSALSGAAIGLAAVGLAVTAWHFRRSSSAEVV